MARVQVGGKGKKWILNTNPCYSGFTPFAPATLSAGAAGPGGEAAPKAGPTCKLGACPDREDGGGGPPGAQLGQAGQQQGANRPVCGEQEVLSVRAHETKAGWKR